MTIYNRICALPDYEKESIFKFYEHYLGSVAVREVLGECHFQALEYCTSSNCPQDYRKKLKENLEKVQYFYPESDPNWQAIEFFFKKANSAEEYWRKDFLEQFFAQELQQLLVILTNRQRLLISLIDRVKLLHNCSYPDATTDLNSIFNKLEENLSFIIVQLEQTRFAGIYIDDFDGRFEQELIKLINAYSLLLIELAGIYQKFHQQVNCKRLYDYIERLLQASLVIRHPTVKNARACTQKMSLYKFVLKTNSNLKFQADFFAPILLKNVDNKIKCKVLLVNEGVANGLIERPESWSGKNNPETCASLTNQAVDFKEDTEKGFFSAKFERLNASNVTRCERRITDIVTDSKVVFVFHCNFKYGYRDIEVRGFSQPVVFVVHVVQESSAHGTMSWHNALTKNSHSCRNAPQEAPYAEVAKILNDRFFYTTGRGLKLDNLKHIRREAFVDYAGNVTAKAFLKDVLPEFSRNHQKECDIKETKEKKAPSFWDWFYECNKLTVSSFKENWKRGLVEGFIPKQVAQNLLQSEPTGSFIVRFSQSMLGVVSFDNNYGPAPYYNSSEIRDQSLDRFILSHRSLTFLYPNRRTEDVFTSSPGPVSTPVHPGYAKVPPTYIIPKHENGRSPASQNGAYSNISASPDPYNSPAQSFSSPASSSAYSTTNATYPTPTHSVANNAYQQFVQPPPQLQIPQSQLQNSMPPSPQIQNVGLRPNLALQGLQSPQIPSATTPQHPQMFPQSPQTSTSQYQNLQMSSPQQSVQQQQQPIRSQSVHNSFQTQQLQNQQFQPTPFQDDSMDYTINEPIPPFESFRNFQTTSYSSPNYPSPNYQTTFHQQSPNYN